jgi:CheY-like chemotaxis protein
MRVLIVDDSRLSRMMLSKIVEDTIPDATIFEAGSGEEALGVTKDLDQVDIAIIDHNMPGITGIELFDQFRGRLDIAKRVLLTANVQDSVRSKAEENGILFWGKPIDEQVIRPLLLED